MLRTIAAQGSKRRRTNSRATVNPGEGDHNSQNVDPEARKSAAMRKVIDIMRDRDQLPLADLISEANITAPQGDRFTRSELITALTALDDENKVMFYDNMVHKV